MLSMVKFHLVTLVPECERNEKSPKKKDKKETTEMKVEKKKRKRRVEARRQSCKKDSNIINEFFH